MLIRLPNSWEPSTPISDNYVMTVTKNGSLIEFSDNRKLLNRIINEFRRYIYSGNYEYNPSKVHDAFTRTEFELKKAATSKQDKEQLQRAIFCLNKFIEECQTYQASLPKIFQDPALKKCWKITPLKMEEANQTPPKSNSLSRAASSSNLLESNENLLLADSPTLASPEQQKEAEKSTPKETSQPILAASKPAQQVPFLLIKAPATPEKSNFFNQQKMPKTRLLFITNEVSPKDQQTAPPETVDSHEEEVVVSKRPESEPSTALVLVEDAEGPAKASPGISKKVPKKPNPMNKSSIKDLESLYKLMEKQVATLGNIRFKWEYVEDVTTSEKMITGMTNIPFNEAQPQLVARAWRHFKSAFDLPVTLEIAECEGKLLLEINLVHPLGN